MSLLSRLVLVVVLVVAGPVPAPVDALPLAPPVDGPVVAGFSLRSPYAAGHRGVDLAVPAGTPATAPAAGVVSFAGAVAGLVWVTVDHGGLRSTVGPLGTLDVRRGDRVRAGAVLGTSALAHGRPAVHWSVRRGETYLDPLAFDAWVASLVPTAPAAGPAARRRPFAARVR